MEFLEKANSFIYLFFLSKNTKKMKNAKTAVICYVLHLVRGFKKTMLRLVQTKDPARLTSLQSLTRYKQ